MRPITPLILKAAAPLPQIESFSRFLFIGPHPDDIEIGAGATAAKLVAEGKQVAFLICLDGRYGDAFSNGVRGDDLAALRKEESRKAASVLGVLDVRFLDLCDGGFYSKKELICGIAREVSDFAPDVIFAPDPLSENECHADHLNVGRAARQIACFAPHAGIMERYGASAVSVEGIAFYMTAKQNRYVRTSEALLQKQMKAIFDCHKSQYPDGGADEKNIRTYLKLRSVLSGLCCASLHAEGFRLLDRTHMHCLPENG